MSYQMFEMDISFLQLAAQMHVLKLCKYCRNCYFLSDLVARQCGELFCLLCFVLCFSPRDSNSSLLSCKYC